MKLEALVLGLLSPLVGLRFFFTLGSARRWMMAPFFMALLLLFGLVVFNIWFLVAFDLPATPPSWLQFSGTSAIPPWVFEVFYAILVLLLSTIVGWITLRVAIAPFLGKVSEAVLLHMGDPCKGAQQFVRMFWLSILRSIILIIISIPLFILLLFPGVNLLAAFLFGLLFASDILDYSLEAIGLNLKERWAFLRQNLMTLVGLSLSQMLLATIPGFGILFLPLSVAGAAELVIRIRSRSDLT